MTTRIHARGPLSAALPILLLALCAAASPAGAARRDPMPPSYRSAEALREAQAILRAMDLLKPGGYTSGRLDQPTGRALRSFQQEHFLDPSGVLDFETYALLTTHGRAAHGGPAAVRRPAGAPVRQASLTQSGNPDRAAAAEARDREMPETAGTIPGIALAGALLLAGGAALLRGRRG